MELITKTYLPVFTGFYSTFFEMDDNRIIEDLDSQLPENIKLTLEQYHKIWETKAYNNASEQYHKDMVTACCEAVESELKDNGFISGLVCEGLVSPREYNFHNDSINIEVLFSDDNIKNIIDFINNNNKAWCKYLLDNFTSRSGFIPFYDNTPNSDDWANITECLSHKTKAGVILEFICEVNGYDSEKLYYSDSVSSVYPYINIDDVLTELNK